MTPEQQIKFEIEKNQVALGQRRTVNSFEAYLQDDEYGQALSHYLNKQSGEHQGNTIYQTKEFGYDRIQDGEIVTLNAQKDAIMVYDNSGKFKEALNFDGSKNSYLTEFYQGIDIIIIPPLITPIPEASGPITTAHDGSEKVEVVSDTGGDQIPEKGPIHTGHGGGLEGIEVVNDTGGDQILEHDWRDYVLTADNRLPIPEKTTARNGLDVESNTKHTPGAPGFRPDAGVEPKNSLDLFDKSVSTDDPKVRLAIDDGNIHRFSNSSKDGSGSYHWSGSTGDKNPLGHNELRKFNDIIKQLKAK